VPIQLSNHFAGRMKVLPTLPAESIQQAQGKAAGFPSWRAALLFVSSMD
jgi:hypothetical protein